MAKVKTGLDNLEAHASLFAGQRVGVITNHTGINGQYTSTVDVLASKLRLAALFAPEHGLHGALQAGEIVETHQHPTYQVPVYSLYGTSNKPSNQMLRHIDVLVFDIQDVGSRYYTYIYTMAYAMEQCARLQLPFVVLDRPNPLGGEMVEGNMVEGNYVSFVGLYPLPQRYGLTIGELAGLFKGAFGISCPLTVVKMTDWKRNLYFEETGLCWVSPSPNMPTLDTALVYNGTALFEGTNVSEGRGTTRPFECIGAPWLDGEILSQEMNALKLPGVYFRPVHFTPTWAKHKGEPCQGVQVHVRQRDCFLPVSTGLHLLHKVKELSGPSFKFLPSDGPNHKPYIDLLSGSDDIRQGVGLHCIREKYHRDSQHFLRLKEKYHLY